MKKNGPRKIVIYARGGMQIIDYSIYGIRWIMIGSLTHTGEKNKKIITSSSYQDKLDYSFLEQMGNTRLLDNLSYIHLFNTLETFLDQTSAL
jgi:hypothetical protein